MIFAQYIGELAGIGTSIAFAFGSTLFTLSGRILGSPLVNRTRLVIALVGVLIVHLLWFGEALPQDAGYQPWFWLSVSGFVGLAIGDGLLFQAFVLLGPRLSMLIFSTNPIIAAILGWVFFGETLDLFDFLGVSITLAGIALVVTERSEKPKNDAPNLTTRTYVLGLLFALGGAAGQAGGQVLAKAGLANDFPTFSALLIRLIAATITIWVLTIAQRQVRSSFVKLRANPRAVAMLIVAALVGPIVGVWLSLVAIQNAPIGIATTLSSLTPIFLIPVSYFVFGDKVTSQAMFGTIVAVAGTTLLFF
ncbi:MAG: DMT family transporter [Chloroflexota bacterium]